MFQSATQIPGFPKPSVDPVRRRTRSVSICHADSWLPKAPHRSAIRPHPRSFNLPRRFLASQTPFLSTALECDKKPLIRAPGRELYFVSVSLVWYHCCQPTKRIVMRCPSLRAPPVLLPHASPLDLT